MLRGWLLRILHTNMRQSKVLGRNSEFIGKIRRQLTNILISAACGCMIRKKSHPQPKSRYRRYRLPSFTAMIELLRSVLSMLAISSYSGADDGNRTRLTLSAISCFADFPTVYA